MQREGRVFSTLAGVRTSVAAVAGIAAAACMAASAPAAATSPSLLWSGAKQVAVNCLVQSSAALETAALQDSLCARVQALAERQASIPVRQVQAGDPLLVASDTIVLFVHASIEPAGRGRTLAFSIRPYRPAGEEQVFYGTAPRALALPSGKIGPALDAGLRAALAELLPWQQSDALVARPLR